MYAWWNFTQLIAEPISNVATPAATSPHPARRHASPVPPSGRRRVARNHTPVPITANDIAHPAGRRVSMVANNNPNVTTTRLGLGSSHAAVRLAAVAMV